LTATARRDSTSITIPVIDPDAPNLYGSWIPAQTLSCADEEMPGMVAIRPDGRFLIAYPERTRGWGDEYTYSFDPDAGTFTLGTQTGQVRVLEEGRIVFSGFAFPSGRPPPPVPPGAPPRPSQASCEFEFVRVGEQY
jgi:hypothetical protein